MMWVKPNKGTILSKRLMFYHWILFSIETLYWKLNAGIGYSLQYDSWIINGMKFPSEFFRDIKYLKKCSFEFNFNKDKLEIKRIN